MQSSGGPMLSLKVALLELMQPAFAALGTQMNRQIALTMGYPQDTVNRPIVAVIRKAAQPTFYVGEQGGPFVPPGAPMNTPPGMTEVILEEEIIVHLEVVDNFSELELMYTTLIPLLVGNLANLAAAGFANARFEVGEESMVPVDQGRARWYYGLPVTVSAQQQIHDRDVLIPNPPDGSVSTVTVSVTPQTVSPITVTSTSVTGTAVVSGQTVPLGELSLVTQFTPVVSILGQ